MPPQRELDLLRVGVLGGFALVFWFLAAMLLRAGCWLYNRLARARPEPTLGEMLTEGRPPVARQFMTGVNEPTWGHALLITLGMVAAGFITAGLGAWARYGFTDPITKPLLAYSHFVLGPVQFLLGSGVIALLLPTTYWRAVAINFLTTTLVACIAGVIFGLLFALGITLGQLTA